MEEIALMRSQGLKPTAGNIERLGVEVGDDLARWAFMQWRLRAKARAKFTKADDMLFVGDALEQATREAVAAYHASCYPEGVIVGDLTCGIGGDLIALARRGPVIGFDLDPEKVRCAIHNLRALGLSGEVQVGDGLASAEGLECAFVDPSRRVGGRRLVNPQDYAPSIDQVVNVGSGMRLMGIKLSPMVRDETLDQWANSLEFVSFRRECLEALLWIGEDSRPGRWAVLAERGERLAATGEGPTVAGPDNFVFEADPAAIRAHALGALCEAEGLRLLGNSNGYLTGSKLVESLWLRAFRTFVELPFDRKSIRSALARLGLRAETIKSHGHKIDSVAVGRDLRTQEGEPATLLIYPSGGKVRAIIAIEVASQEI